MPGRSTTQKNALLIPSALFPSSAKVVQNQRKPLQLSLRYANSIEMSFGQRLCENYSALAKRLKNAHEHGFFWHLESANGNERTLMHVLFSSQEFSHSLGRNATKPRLIRRAICRLGRIERTGFKWAAISAKCPQQTITHSDRRRHEVSVVAAHGRDGQKRDDSQPADHEHQRCVLIR